MARCGAGVALGLARWVVGTVSTPSTFWTAAFHKLTGDVIVEVLDFPAPDLVLVEFSNGVRRELARRMVTVYVSRFPSPHKCTDGTTRHLTKDSGIAELPVTGPALDRLVGAIEFESAWQKIRRVGGREHNDTLHTELRSRVRAADANTLQLAAGVARDFAADLANGTWKP